MEVLRDQLPVARFAVAVAKNGERELRQSQREQLRSGRALHSSDGDRLAFQLPPTTNATESWNGFFDGCRLWDES